jgi:hypothetical protein
VFFLFGKKTKHRRVPNGRSERRRCPECGQTALFVEHEEESKVTAYHVVELWSSDDRVFVCSACGEAMDLEDTEAPALTAKEREAQRATEARAAETRAKEKAKQDKRVEKEIDRELAALKKRLGRD